MAFCSEPIEGELLDFAQRLLKPIQIFSHSLGNWSIRVGEALGQFARSLKEKFDDAGAKAELRLHYNWG